MPTVNSLPTLAPFRCRLPDGRIVPVHFRPGAPADAHPLHAHCYPERPWPQFAAAFERAGRRQQHGRGVWLVGVTEEGVVAGGQLLLHGRRAEIADVAVSTPWRRRGVATALLLALDIVAVRYAVDDLEIGVLQANAAALTLYRRLGFSLRRSLTTPSGPAYILGRHLA